MMVSVLDSGFERPGFESWLGQKRERNWEKSFKFTVPFSTQEYKLTNKNHQGSLVKSWGQTLQWITIPSRGEK